MGSLWIETTKNKSDFKTLEGNEETEVCVIGGGLFGLTAAYYLTKCGKKVIVLEKGVISEIGTHQELANKEGLYKTLWDIQGALEKEFDSTRGG